MKMLRICKGSFCSNYIEIDPKKNYIQFLCESCGKDKIQQDWIFHQISQGRYVSVEWFDVYANEKYENGKFIGAKKLCRVCGGEVKHRSSNYCVAHDYTDVLDLAGCVLNFSDLANYIKKKRKQCEKCGDDGEEVHHKIPVHQSQHDWTLIFQIENLILLCKKCHNEAHESQAKQDEKALKLSHKSLDFFIEQRRQQI